MRIHQGWFTALYTQHLFNSQSLEFEISKGGYPVTLLPPPRRLARSLGQGTTWVRQPRSGSCHYPTAATKCNERPIQATANHVSGKACSSTKGPDSQSLEFEICIFPRLSHYKVMSQLITCKINAAEHVFVLDFNEGQSDIMNCVWSVSSINRKQNH